MLHQSPFSYGFEHEHSKKNTPKESGNKMMNSSHQDGSHVALHMFKNLTQWKGLQSESFGSKNMEFG
jgi:hypothetical protein